MAASGTQVFAVNNRGIFLSTNYGLNWINKNNNISDTNITSLCITGGNLFAGTNGSGIFVSTNSGGNWSPANNGLVYQYATSLASNSTRMFVGVWRIGLYYSTNDGALWNKSNYSTQAINALITRDSIVYAGVDFGVYRSTNNGVDFSFSGLAIGSVVDISFCNNYLFAAVPGKGIYRSTGNDTSWVAVNFGIVSLRVRALKTIGSDIYAGTDSGGVYVSSNSGSNWIARNGGLPNKTVFGITNNNSYLFAATDVGVYRSSNNGNNWTLSNTGLPPYSTSSINSRGSNIFVSATDGIYLSTNNGENWNKINDGMNSVLNARTILLTNNYVFAGVYSAGVWKRPLSEIIGIQNISTEIPSSYSLGQNYPNPFNPITVIRFNITGFPVGTSGNDKVVLKVYDVMGREVQTLVNEKLNAGTYEVKFDGNMLTSGVYFYKMVSEGFTETKRMILLK